jgi:hypothetical protein
MPNHCDSDMTITGPEEVLGEFLAKHVTKADGSLLDLDSIRPYPKYFAELDRAAREYEEQHPGDWRGRPKDGFNSGGYDSYERGVGYQCHTVVEAGRVVSNESGDYDGERGG